MALTVLSLILPIILIHLTCAASNFVKIECKEKQVALLGQDALLECVLVTTQVIKDFEIKSVKWTKFPRNESDPFALIFSEKENSSGNGYSFAEPHWNNKNRNVSLLISKAAVQHEGFYECQVGTNAGYPEPDKLISFNVTAKYTKPTIQFTEKMSKNEEGILECKSRGYPEGQLHWLDEGNHEWSTSATMHSKKMENGLIELSSRLTLLKGSIFNFTCAVFNAAGHREDQSAMPKSDRDWMTGSQPAQGQAVKIAAPLVVIGSLLVALLLAVTYKLYCKKRPHRKPTSQSVAEEGENEPWNLGT